MQSLSRAVLACLLVLFAGISACVTTSEDSGIKDLAADTKLHPVVQTGHFSAVTSVAFSLDGQYALSGSRDHTLKLWNVLSGREIRTFKGHTDVVSSVSYTPDGRFAVSASWDKTVKMWDVATGALVRDMQGHAEKRFLATAAMLYPPVQTNPPSLGACATGLGTGFSEVTGSNSGHGPGMNTPV